MKAFLYFALIACLLILGACASLDNDTLKAGSMLLLALATGLLGLFDHFAFGSE